MALYTAWNDVACDIDRLLSFANANHVSQGMGRNGIQPELGLLQTVSSCFRLLATLLCNDVQVSSRANSNCTV